MKRLPFFFVLFLCLSLPDIPVAATGNSVEITKSHYIKQFGTREGLTQPGITAVLTDADGAVWIGTRYRLNKYLNGNLVAYDYSQLGGSYIYMLYQDEGKDVWVGTESGLIKYDKHTDTFSPVYTGRILCAAEAGGSIYFCGRGDIAVYGREDASLSFLHNEGESIVDAFPIENDVLVLADNRRGLFALNTASGHMGRIPVPELEDKRILSAASFQGDIFVGTYLDGIYRMNRNGKVLSHYGVQDNPSVSLDVVCDICTLDGRICFATDGGGICTLEGGRIVPITDIPGYAGLSVLPPALTRIYQDSFSNIWVGSVKDGLFGIRQTDIQRMDGFGSHAQNPVILSLCEDGKTLWIGTDNEIMGYIPGEKSLRQLPSTQGNIISSLCDYGPDQLLASIYCKGLYVLDKKTGRRKRLLLVNQAIDDLEQKTGYGQNVYHLTERQILIAGQSLYGYNLETGEFSTFAVDFGVDPAGLKPFRQQNRPEEIYGYTSSKLYHIDRVRERVSFLYEAEGCGRINTAAMSGGTIYFGTDTGLFSFDEDSHTTSAIYPNVFSRVTTLCERNDSTLWIVADNTLYSYNRRARKVDFFDEAEGFITNEVNSCVQLGETFFFGGNHELSAVPRHIGKRVTASPSLSLSRVLVDGSVAQPKEGQLRVNAKSKNILLEFRLIRGNPFGHTFLKYAVDKDPHKQVTTYDNTFSVNALPPGKHVIYASVYQSDGSWSEPEEMLSITVPEILWRNKWFLGLLTLILVGATLLLIRRILLRANAVAQSAIRENREEDERRRSRFIKGIEVELQRPLSQVIKSIQALMDEAPSPERARGSLEKIYAKSLQMEKILSDAVQQEQLTDPKDPVLEKFQALVQENLSNSKLDVPFLTREMAMSRSILYERIKSQTGMGINEYIQKQRLQKAKKDLVETDRSINQISDDLGFSTPKYFSVLFKSAYGITPKEFRKKIR